MRLASNEIELGIGYRRSNLGQVTYRWQREQRMLLCGLTDKDLHRICGSQYGHPGPAIGYWPEMCLGHVYIVLEPVGSARLRFRWHLYYEFMSFYVPKVVRSPGCDHGHDEESRNGRDVKIDIVYDYIRTSERFRVIRVFSEYLGVTRIHHQKYWALMGHAGKERKASKGGRTPPHGLVRIGLGRGRPLPSFSFSLPFPSLLLLIFGRAPSSTRKGGILLPVGVGLP